jgi:hypothetical protein
VNLDVIRSRILSITPKTRLRITLISSVADRVIDDARLLIAEVQRLRAEVLALRALNEKDD